MSTQCSRTSFDFQRVGRREIRAIFDGGDISSDGGGLLLREVERLTGIVAQFSACFADHRNPVFTEHTVQELVAQRVLALALGYEDLNDHDALRHDPLLAALVGKIDVKGEQRSARDQGKPLAGKSTLNRLELTPETASAGDRYKKVVLDHDAVDRFLVAVFLQAHTQPEDEIILDLDATDDPLHGHQEGRFFHGYYKSYCYLPLYIFCGEFLLCARLRPSNLDGAQGSVEELERIVGQIRQAWPAVRITIRGDSGFCREPIMAWCEGHDVDFVLGLARNPRLVGAIEDAQAAAKGDYEETGEPARTFTEFAYRTRTSWSRARRVIAKAEHLAKGPNPRFVVTSLPPDTADARWLYEALYSARGDMENRIKEQQLYLFADRTSTAWLRSNQTRLYFSSVAYLLLQALRRLALKGTELAKAQCHTLRVKLLKVGAAVRVTVRKVWVSLAESYPYADLFAQAYRNLRHRTPVHR